MFAWLANSELLHICHYVDKEERTLHVKTLQCLLIFKSSLLVKRISLETLQTRRSRCVLTVCKNIKNLKKRKSGSLIWTSRILLKKVYVKIIALIWHIHITIFQCDVYCERDLILNNWQEKPEYEIY